MNKEVRICGSCEYFDLKHSTMGRCFLFDSTDPEKRTYIGCVGEEDPCRYSLHVEERVELTRGGIAKILNRFLDDFVEELVEDDINVETVLDGLKRL